MLAGGLALLAVSLAYSEALSRWGTPEVVGQLTRTTADLRATIGAVPRPIEFLVGYPALAWGVSSRARRRQGWWGTGFGAAGLAVVTVTLLNRELALTEAGLGLVYSLVIGLVLGFLVIRADTFLSGARGRRARRAEEASAHRPEPGRLRPLM
jgi:peptidoglycan/LPS O-acetylase OafA/YrhL